MTNPSPVFSWALAGRALFFLSFSAISALADPLGQLTFRHYSDPVFPLPLLSTTVTRGHATVAYLVGANGRIEDALTVSDSHPTFGQAILEAMNSWEVDPTAAVPRRREMIRQWRFSPPISEGRPVLVQVEREFSFIVR